jgi:hypothetical protein
VCVQQKALGGKEGQEKESDRRVLQTKKENRDRSYKMDHEHKKLQSNHSPNPDRGKQVEVFVV